MRKKFKIKFPEGHSKAGEVYKPAKGDMVVMNSQGVFFYFYGEDYCQGITKLSNVIGNYDVEWKE